VRLCLASSVRRDAASEGTSGWSRCFERGSAVGLTGHEGAVDGGGREARELVSDRALWIVAERDRDLRPQQLKRVLADAAHDGLDLPVAGGCAAKTISRRSRLTQPFRQGAAATLTQWATGS
jgi:hypothetical protein